MWRLIFRFSTGIGVAGCVAAGVLMALYGSDFGVTLASMIVGTFGILGLATTGPQRH